MKFKANHFVRVSSVFTTITLLAIVPSLRGLSLTWDTTSGDGATITANGGTWDLSTGNLVWNNAGANPNLGWTQTNTTTPLHTATFAGTDTGSKSIIVGADIAATSLTFNNSGYTLSAVDSKTIRLNGALSVASGKTATIGSNVNITRTTTAALDISGGGTIYLQGTGAKISGNSNNLNISGGTTLDVGTGGLCSSPSQLVIGSSGAGGNVFVNSGSVSAGATGTVASSAQNIVLHNLTTTGSSELTINDGSVINLGTGRASGGESGLRFGATASTTAAVSATVNLNGGSLTVARVYEGNTGAGLTSTFNFNGGTLKVTTGAGNAANFMGGLNNAFVKEGGAIIDTNGVATTVAQVLQHGGAAAIDGGLTKSGSGALTLTGSNSYTGVTTVNAGTLTLGHATNTLPDAGGVTVAGGILDVANADTVGTVILSGGTISGVSALTGSSYDLRSGTISGAVLASGVAKNKTTSGTVTLAGVQSYTDATNVNQGVLNVTGSLASAITVANGAQLKGEGSTSGNVTFQAGSKFLFDPLTTGATDFFRSTGTIDTTAGATTKIVIDLATTVTSGTGYVVFEGSSLSTNGLSDFKLNSRGTLNLTPTQLLFDAGVGSVVWNGGNGTNPTFWDVNSTTENFTLDGVDDFFLSGDNVTFDDSAGSYAVAIQGASVTPGSVTFNNSTNSYTLSGGAITGTAAIVKNGSNTVILGNANTNTGGTTINSGTIQLGDGTNATGSLTGAIVNHGTLETNHGSNNITLSNDISGNGTYIKSGAGTVILTGANSYAGTTTINAGTLQIGSNGSVGTLGTGAVVNDGSLVFDRTDGLVANNDVSGSGGITKQRASGLTLGGTLSHGGGIAVTAGHLNLGGNNSYTGQTTVSAGAGVVVTANNALGATGTGNETVLLGGGGANSGAIGLSGGINYGAGEKIIGAGLSNTASTTAFTAVQRGIVQSISGNNTFAGNVEINSSGITRFGTQDGADLTLSGSITRSSGVTGVTVLFRPGISGDWVTVSGSGSNWDNETLIFLTSNNTSPGGVRLGADDALSTVATLRAGGNTTGSGNTLDLNGFDQTVGGLFNSNGTLHITNNAASTNSLLTLNTAADWSSDSANNKTTLEDGAGQVSLAKTGSFSQILAGTHTYTGTTTVSGGSLIINGNISTSTQTTVESGATLGGSGTVGNLTVEAGGTVAPGNSPGILTVGDYDQAGTLSLELNGTSPGTGYDQLNVTGTVTLSGLLAATVGYTPVDGNLLFILANDGVDAISGTFSGLADLSTFSLGGFEWQISYHADYAGGGTGTFTGGNDIALMAVPETSSLLLASLGFIPLFRRRRA